MGLPSIFDDTSIADGPSAVGAVVLVAACAVTTRTAEPTPAPVDGPSSLLSQRCALGSG